MDSGDVSTWFDEYLDAFAACGRGERDPSSMLAYYGLPILFTTDRGMFALTSGDQVAAAVTPQVEEMRAAGYDRSEILERDVTEISQLTVTYLVTDGPVGRRVSVLALHRP